MSAFVEDGFVEEGFVEGNSSTNEDNNGVNMSCNFNSEIKSLIENFIKNEFSSNINFLNSQSSIRDNEIKDKISSIKLPNLSSLESNLKSFISSEISKILTTSSNDLMMNSLNGVSGSLPDHTKVIFVFSNDIFEVSSSFFIVNGQDSYLICYLLKNLNTNALIYCPASFVSEISSDLIEQDSNNKWHLKKEGN